jgi:predicted AAA+ superfamily ATPase
MSDFVIPGKIIERNKYTEKVAPFIRKPVAKVFTGQRRVGKSYLLFQIMRHLMQVEEHPNIIYVNLEDIRHSELRTAGLLHQHIAGQLAADRYNYIFIDEIQEVESFEQAVRSLLLNEKNDIYITGSNAEILSGELATLLAGRTIEITVHSLSYIEFLQFHQCENTAEALEKFLRYGGMPFLHNLPLTDEFIFEYLANIYNTVVYRDVVARHHIRNHQFLEKLIQFMADTTGSLFSAKNISDYLKSQKTEVAHNQVISFARHLRNAFLINEAQRYDVKGKRIFEVGAKFYFNDLGIRNAIAGYRTADRGKLTENAIYNHLQFTGYKVYVGALNTREIDFVAQKQQETVYIQAARQIDSDETARRELEPLLKIPDSYPKWLVTLYGESKNSTEGIRHISLREFLTSFN